MTFSMTVNVKGTVEYESHTFYETHIADISAATDSLYLQYKLTTCVLTYPRKYTNCTISLQECHFPIPIRHTEKHQFC